MPASRPGGGWDRLPLSMPLLLSLSACAPDLAPFERTLAAQDSATAALGEWCKARGIADPPTIKAQRITEGDRPPPAEVSRLLGIGPNERVAYRHVRLSCGDTVLSIAHNWYVPALLTPEMNHLLNDSDTPFGKAVAPLGFSRERLESRRGPAESCPKDTVLAHRALLRLPEGKPFSALVECYTPANLAP